jgi:hypothetical protein
MAPPKLAAKSIASTAADAAHAELSKYVEAHTPGIVDKKIDTQPNFNKFLKTEDLQKTNELVTDFLDVSSASKAFSLSRRITYKVTECRQETRCGIPRIKRHSTYKIIPSALLRSTYREMVQGGRESHNICCAGPAIL